MLRKIDWEIEESLVRFSFFNVQNPDWFIKFEVQRSSMRNSLLGAVSVRILNNIIIRNNRGGAPKNVGPWWAFHRIHCRCLRPARAARQKVEPRTNTSTKTKVDATTGGSSHFLTMTWVLNNWRKGKNEVNGEHLAMGSDKSHVCYAWTRQEASVIASAITNKRSPFVMFENVASKAFRGLPQRHQTGDLIANKVFLS